MATMAAPAEESIEVTFTWDANVGGPEGGLAPLTLVVPEDVLEKRDPEGTSIISAKMRFCASKSFSLSANGPGDGERY